MSAEVIGRGGKQNTSRWFEDKDKSEEWEIVLINMENTILKSELLTYFEQKIELYEGH